VEVRVIIAIKLIQAWFAFASDKKENAVYRREKNSVPSKTFLEA